MTKPDRKKAEANVLRHALSALLLGTGVLHLVVAAIGTQSDLRMPLALFGVLYTIMGVWTRKGGRTSVLTAMLVTAVGLGVGGTHYLTDGGPRVLPLMFVIDVAILMAGGLWLRGARPKR